MNRVIIAGSRIFSDYDLLKRKMDHLCQNLEGFEIVSGCARGADLLGERYAKERCYYVKKFSADWGKYGKGAGFKRNNEMAEYATHLVLFWDGVSAGSKMMLKLAKDHGLKVRIVFFKAVTI